MAGDLLLRFVVGGLIVCAFAVLGEVFRPRTFAGLFGAAPSVAPAGASGCWPSPWSSGNWRPSSTPGWCS